MHEIERIKRLKAVIELDKKLNRGEFSDEDYSSLIKIAEEERTPRVNLAFGKASFLGLGTSKDLDESYSFFQEVYLHGNEEILSWMFFFLMEQPELEDRFKILAVDAIRKAKEEFFELYNEDYDRNPEA